MKSQKNMDIANFEKDLHKFDIKSFNVACSPHLSANNSVIFDDYKVFVNFLKNEKIKSLFVISLSLSIEDFYISEDTVKEFFGEYATNDLSEILEKAIVDYNLSIEQYEKKLNELSQTLYFTVYNGYVIYITFSDWVDFAEPSEKLKQILAEKRFEIESEKTQNRLLIAKLEEKLKQNILNDPSFYNCTNLNLRRKYAYKLWDNLSEEYNPLKKSWKLAPSMVVFVDTIWSEYKNSKTLK